MSPAIDRPLVTQQLLEQLKNSKSSFKIADSTGTELKGTDFLIRTLALRRYLLREVLAEDEPHVGIFCRRSWPASRLTLPWPSPVESPSTSTTPSPRQR